MIAEILPSTFSGSVIAPASKSASHRTLICAALSDKPCKIYNLGDSDDIKATLSVLEAFGCEYEKTDDALILSPCKRNIENVTVCCNESGSTARFLLPIAAALGAHNVTLTGKGRLPERPFKTLTDALKQSSVDCSAENLPITLTGKLKSGTYSLPGNISSQYISGLLLALSITEGKSFINITSPLESKGYVDMTISELEAFGADIEKTENGYIINGKPSLTATDRAVEGDWSQAAFFLCAGAIKGSITVKGLDLNSLQGDKAILDVLKSFGAKIEIVNDGITVYESALKGINVDCAQIPDLVPIIDVTAAMAEGKTTIYNAERLRLKESDRLYETVLRLNKFGIEATVTEDGMEIIGQKPHSAYVTSANDHRIVMAFSVLASFCQEKSQIEGANAINKSYPLFFRDFKKAGGNCNVISDR